MSKRRSATPNDDEVHNALLGDLESIRALLEAPPHEPGFVQDGDGVPMLEDMVDGALSINEGTLTSRTSMDDDSGAGTSRLADETMRTLLGAEWRSSARRIVSDARAAVATTGEQWTPAQADALNEALKVRIDSTLDDWLTDVMYARIDDLRERLLRLLESEIKQFTDALKDNDDYGK